MPPCEKEKEQEKYATEQQLGRLFAACFVVRLEAVHVASWLCANHVSCATHAVEGTSRTAVSTSLTLVLPLMERRARARRVLLSSMLRYSSRPRPAVLKTESGQPRPISWTCLWHLQMKRSTLHVASRCIAAAVGSAWKRNGWCLSCLL